MNNNNRNPAYGYSISSHIPHTSVADGAPHTRCTRNGTYCNTTQCYDQREIAPMTKFWLHHNPYCKEVEICQPCPAPPTQGDSCPVCLDDFIFADPPSTLEDMERYENPDSVIPEPFILTACGHALCFSCAVSICEDDKNVSGFHRDRSLEMVCPLCRGVSYHAIRCREPVVAVVSNNNNNNNNATINPPSSQTLDVSSYMELIKFHYDESVKAQSLLLEKENEIRKLRAAVFRLKSQLKKADRKLGVKYTPYLRSRNPNLMKKKEEEGDETEEEDKDDVDTL